MSSKSVPKSTLGPRGSIVLRAPPKPLVVEESTQNVVDLHAGAAAGSTAPVLAEGPSFFVLQSSTSLFAGVPHLSGKLDGEALQATFHTPTDIIFDENQQMFVADRNNARIRRINKAMKVSTIASISGGDGDIENCQSRSNDNAHVVLLPDVELLRWCTPDDATADLMLVLDKFALVLLYLC
jgi:hypothetical protein